MHFLLLASRVKPTNRMSLHISHTRFTELIACVLLFVLIPDILITGFKLQRWAFANPEVQPLSKWPTQLLRYNPVPSDPQDGFCRFSQQLLDFGCDRCWGEDRCYVCYTSNLTRVDRSPLDTLCNIQVHRLQRH